MKELERGKQNSKNQWSYEAYFIVKTTPKEELKNKFYIFVNYDIIYLPSILIRVYT